MYIQEIKVLIIILIIYDQVFLTKENTLENEAKVK